ncbi:type II toxin-antitoxin system HicA family toxin [Gordonia iterans]
MIASQPTRTTVKRLKKAVFTRTDGKGSHATYRCPHGRVPVTVPDGHREISPGVLRKILKAIEDCQANCPK